uniref:Niban apoptosis regulator 2a n=1 Tax=Kryptolebias marmoratus TaxID=37003 RepID=A0A3Q3AUT0_KRYMA
MMMRRTMNCCLCLLCVSAARTGAVLKEFGGLYEQQYAVALFNAVRYEIEGGGGTQSQLLHRKDSLEGRSIFSGSLFQYLEENRKWRNRFVSVPNSYAINLYESKMAHERGLHPKASINCAGYKALTSMEEYLELMGGSLPGGNAQNGTKSLFFNLNVFLLTVVPAGLPEDSPVHTPAFTDSVRRFRQSKGHFGTWDMMCGAPPQILANLVMETLQPELRTQIAPRLKGKLQQRQRNWMLVSSSGGRNPEKRRRAEKVPLDARLRTDMDQLVTTKEHVSSKIKALVSPRSDELLQTSVQPYIGSILDALMEPTSRGFSEVRDVFFKELVEISKNSLNGGGREKLGERLERLSMLAFHPVKMQSCYKQMEQLNLEGLQQRFDVSSPSVFISRAQILMRQQMDNAVYTFEQLLQQSLESQGEEDVCKSIQRCQDRVLKKYDYDSSTVRKKFFREALLQIIIPYMLQQLAPVCTPELPRFKELIFEDLSRFLLVEDMYEEVVLQSVTKDIMMAVKEAAVQRKHNLYRDSIILTNSDPNLHLLEDTPQVDWATKFGGDETEGAVSRNAEGRSSGGRRKQVVSMIQLDGMPEEECLEPSEDPKSPDSVNEIRDLINPMVEVELPEPEENLEEITSGTEATAGTITMEDGLEEQVTHVTTVVGDLSKKSLRDKPSPQTIVRELMGSQKRNADVDLQEEEAIQKAIEEMELAVQDGGSEPDCESQPRYDSGFQSPTNEGEPLANGEAKVTDPEDVDEHLV